ncbi:MAG: hypothetical protein FWE02_04410 [Defluviitaleaceae bacterium]|nr:hypothetical protein [Defluviitaleaceae bacterium]
MLKRIFKTLAYISINIILILLVIQLVIFVFNEAFEFGRETIAEIFYEEEYEEIEGYYNEEHYTEGYDYEGNYQEGYDTE